MGPHEPQPGVHAPPADRPERECAPDRPEVDTRSERRLAWDGAGESTGIAIVLGTRPEIIKLAPVILACERRGLPYTLIHTGQHYSEDLDEIFFEQFDLEPPAHDLGVGSASHGVQTAEMLTGIERILQDERPDVLLVQGDTNSVLAGALAASKLQVPVGHVEAGLRSFDRDMPEEINRVVTDHVSTYLFAPTPTAAAQLEREAVAGDIVETGNTVVDALYTFRDLARERSTVLADRGLRAGEFYLMTAHRAENVDDAERFASLLGGVARFARETDRPVLYPIHPRAADRLDAFDLDVPEGIEVIEPQSFLDFLTLEDAAALVFTDSGGVQEETCILGTPCVTLRYSTERPETAFVGANMIAGLDPEDVVEAGRRMLGKPGGWTVPFGDGDAADRILDAVEPALRANGGVVA